MESEEEVSRCKQIEVYQTMDHMVGHPTVDHTMKVTTVAHPSIKDV